MAANSSKSRSSSSKSSSSRSTVNQTGSSRTATTDDKEPEFSVVSNDGRRTHFRGNEDDARRYVQNNFPHMHVEPGTDYGDDGPQPDVFVRDSKGNLSGLVAGEWVDYKE